MTILEQAINCDDGDRAARIIMAAWYRIRRGGELTASPVLANGSRAARRHHWQLAPSGGGIPSLAAERRFPPPWLLKLFQCDRRERPQFKYALLFRWATES